MSISTKTCTACRQELPATEEHFHWQKNPRSGKYRLRAVCKPCRRERQRERHYANGTARPEKLPDGKKRCSQCGEAKPATADHFTTDNGRVRNPCRDCPRKRNRDAYYANPETYAARSAEWAAANPERVKASARKHHAANLERIRARAREYAAKNKAKRTEYSRAWRNTPRGRILHAAKEQRRRARLKGVGGTYSAEDIALKFKQQNGRCHWCRKAIAMTDHHVDHVWPISKGGHNSPSNLCLSCAACNRKKAARPPWDFTGRLL